MAISNGTYKARVQGECVLGMSKTKGTPFIEFYLTITDGDNKGGRARWTGYFTENTNERSVQSLQICGWAGDDLSEFEDGGLHGLDANEVEIVVELETYKNEAGEDRMSPRVAWINRGGGFLNKASAMNPEAAKSFGDRMRGLVLKAKEKNPVATPNPAPGYGARPTQGPAASDADTDEIPF